MPHYSVRKKERAEFGLLHFSRRRRGRVKNCAVGHFRGRQRESGRVHRHQQPSGVGCDCRFGCDAENLDLRAREHPAAVRVVLLLLIVGWTVFPIAMMHGTHPACTVRWGVRFLERRLAAAGDPETASREDQGDNQRCNSPPHDVGQYSSNVLGL